MKKILLLLCLSIALFANTQSADKIGFVDEITINGREFESLEQRKIEFYPEDLQNGKVVVQGLLEPLSKKQSIKDVFVEITIDGGKTWKKVSGHKNWSYSFSPVYGQLYEFSLRLTKKDKVNNTNETLSISNEFKIAGFTLRPSLNIKNQNGKLSGSGEIFVPWLQNLNVEPNLKVNFENLSFDGDVITNGLVVYDKPFDISIADISLHIDSMQFSPNISENKILGKINFTDNSFLTNIANLSFDNLSFNLQGINGDIEYKNNKKLDIWEEQDVSLDFNSLKINLSYKLVGGFSVKVVDLDANLNFGNFFNSAKKKLQVAKDSLGNNIPGIYEWKHSVTTELIDNSSLMISNILGKLDLSDLQNPKIIFDANASLDSLGGVFSSLNSINIKNATISKYGFFASVETNIPDIDIWKEQNVKLQFLDKTKLNFVVDRGGFDISVLGANMQLDFGNLLQNAKASIQPIISDVQGDIQNTYSWALNTSKKLKNDIDLTLKQLNGQLDLSSLTNPKILINAQADLRALGGIFSTITAASIKDGIISKDGVDLKLGVLLNDLDIWEEKGVKLEFVGDDIPTAHLKLSRSGDYSLDFDNFSAKVNFGTLIPQAKAIMKKVKDKKGIYNLVLDSANDLKLIDDKIKLKNFVSSLDLSDLKNPIINFNTKAILNNFDNILPNLNELDIKNAKISKKGFSASASFSLSNIDIWEERKVKLAFSSAPKIDLKISDEVSFDLDISGAKLDFGDLLDGAIVQLNKFEQEVNNEIIRTYKWALNSKKSIVNTAKAKLSSIGGELDLRDLSNPKILLNSKLDLSSYGGAFSSINSISLKDAVISKNGFGASANIDVQKLDIWKEKKVKLVFDENPSISFKVTSSDFNIGFSNITGRLDFGHLLDGAIAKIRKSQELAQNIYDDAQELIESDRIFTWELSGEYPLYKNQLKLNTLSGTLDFSSLSNPIISLNANAKIDSYSDIFKYIRETSIENAQISKGGFKGSFSVEIDDIPIYKEKNVKLIFEDKPTFNLAINSSGLKLGLENLNGNVDFGTLIKDAKTSIQTLKDGLFSWSLEAQKNLASTKVLLKNLQGTLDLKNLKDPKLLLEGKVNLSKYITWLNGVGDINLINAKISKSGFSSTISANMKSIDIWKEKKVKVIFNNGTSPEFKFGYNNSGLVLGLRNMNSSIDFGELLDGEIVSIASKSNYKKVGNIVNTVSNNLTSNISLNNTVQLKQDVDLRNAKDFVLGGQTSIKEGVFSWKLSNSYTLIEDDNVNVKVKNISGSIDLSELSNPIITFDASADFSSYTMSLPANANIRSVKLDDATISKNGIDWNLILEGINASYVIYDMGQPTVEGTIDKDDVSIVLNNANASVGSNSISVGSAAGTLNFGKLFKNKVEPIAISYANDGYTFSTNQSLSFSYEGNALELSGISGTIKKVGSNYSVSFDGKAAVQVDILKNLGISDVSFTGLDISKSGFKGTIVGSWAKAKEYAILNNKAKISLSSIGVSIDTRKTIPISISKIGGYVDLSAIFDSTQAKMAHLGLSYKNKTLSYKASYPLSISKFLFKDLSGNISLEDESLSLGLAGKFGYEGIDNLNIELKDFLISSSGLRGNISYNPSSPVSTFISDLKLRNANVEFTDNISGSFGLDYLKSNFLGSSKTFNLKLDASLDRSGINSISASSNAQELIIDNFAKFNFNSFEISPNFDSNFYLGLGGNLKAINKVVRFNNSIGFSGLKISSNGVSVDNLSANLPTSGASIDLGGFAFSLNSASIGFQSSKFFIDVDGALSLGITKASSGMKLFSNGKYSIDEIGILVDLPALFFGGTVAWGEDDTYGSYFGTKQPLQLRIADFISAKGEFMVGKKADTSYWRAAASGGVGAAGIPLGPINAYTLGGGVAYNMTYTNGKYIPATKGGVVVSLTSLLGTPDLGFTWHGNFDLTIDVGSKQLTLSGDNYILSPKNSTPDNLKISGTITLGTSPRVVHVNISEANIKYKGIGVSGKADILFASREKHVYIGTSDEVQGFKVATHLGPVKLSIFGIGPEGYFMIDTRRLAFGLKYYVNKKLELHIWGPNPYIRLKLYLGADGLLQYNPFYMDLGIQADASLTAGYGSLFSGTIGAGLKIRLRSPNPSFMYVKAYVDIPIYGEASFSTYIPGKPKNKKEQEQKLVLLSGTYANKDISIIPKLKVMTAFRNDGGVVESQENKERKLYRLVLSDVKLAKVETRRRSSGVTIPTSIIEEIPLEKSQEEQTIKQYIPKYPLNSDSSYYLRGKATLYEVKDRKNIRIVATDKVDKVFRTTKEDKISFTELVDYISPNGAERFISNTTKVRMYYKEAIFYTLNRNPKWKKKFLQRYTLEVRDDKLQKVKGDLKLKGDSLEFTPDKPFTIQHYCINELTGEKRDTYKTKDGEYYHNPFNNFKATFEEYEGDEEIEPVVTCYTKNSEYTILVKDIKEDSIVYSSKFSPTYENEKGAAQKKFKDLHHLMHPEVVVSPNLDRTKKYYLNVYNGLKDIGASEGVESKMSYTIHAFDMKDKRSLSSILGGKSLLVIPPGTQEIEEKREGFETDDYWPYIFDEIKKGVFYTISDAKITYYINGKSTGITKDAKIIKGKGYHEENAAIKIGNERFDNIRDKATRTIISPEDIGFGGESSPLGGIPLEGGLTNPGTQYQNIFNEGQFPNNFNNMQNIGGRR
ncbi:MAG: hypothetical protein KGV43_02090 [Arcobacter sp.]|nr:hypothetical protein [Arcobacter sp.]